MLVLITEDWFAVSHFLPLLRAMTGLGLHVTVATRCAGKEAAIIATGADIVPFDYKRGGIDPVRDAGVVLGLRRLIARLRPDALHAIAMKPIALGALIAAAGSGVPTVMHLTGIGLTGTEPSAKARLLHATIVGLIRRRLAQADARLLIENPDDRALFVRADGSGRHGGNRDGDARAGRITLLGGAGLDPETFAALPDPPAPPPLRIAYVGRMIWSKGVDVLVEAFALLRAAGVPVELALCGAPDDENPRPIAIDTLQAWAATPGITWHGFVDDVRTIWREAHVAVVPSRGGEGLPKTLLEAAACGRALIVSDVPGCRHFVRDGQEGLLVPPGDHQALAAAIRRVLDDPKRRQRMGQAARARLLESFTEQHLTTAVQGVYSQLLGLDANAGTVQSIASSPRT